MSVPRVIINVNIRKAKIMLNPINVNVALWKVQIAKAELFDGTLITSRTREYAKLAGQEATLIQALKDIDNAGVEVENMVDEIMANLPAIH